MRKVLAGVLASALIGLAPMPAKANWQYTTWGMTPDEVVAASGGAATLVPDTAPPDQWRITLATADYSAEGFNFQARFLFGRDDRRLVCVALDLKDYSQLPRLETRLGNIYGSPSDRTETAHRGLVLGRRTVWIAENHITLSEFPATPRAVLLHCARRNGGL